MLFNALGIAGIAGIAGFVLPVVLGAATPRVLVYTATTGFRHLSIPTAIEQLEAQQSSWNVTLEFSDTLFTDEKLSTFDALLFVSSAGEITDENGRAALQRYFQSGGVYAGVHSASDALYTDTTYVKAVGALFDYHPQIRTETFEVLDRSHPSTAHLPDQWSFEEEVYHFRSDPRSVGATVLLTVDKSSGSSADTETQGSPHPIAWYNDSPESAQPLRSGAPKPGRSFYTSLGHHDSTWRDENFMRHVMGGLSWALEGRSTRAYGVGLVGNSSGLDAAQGSSASSVASGKTTPSSTSLSILSGSTGSAPVTGSSSVTGSASTASQTSAASLQSPSSLMLLISALGGMMSWGL